MTNKLMYIFNKKDKKRICALLVAVIIGSFLELLGVTIFMPFIEVMTTPEIVNENEYMAFFYQLFNFSSYEYFLVAISVCIIFVYIIKNVFLGLLKNWNYKFSYDMQEKLSTKLLRTYMHEEYTFHLNRNISELQRSIQEDTAMFTQVLLHVLELIAEITICMTIGIYLFMVSKSITVTVVGLLLLCILFFINTTKKFSRQLGKDCQGYKAKLYQWVNQAMGGIKEVKVLHREEFFVDSYQSYYAKYAYGLRMNRLISVMPKYLVETVCMSGLLIAIIIKILFGSKDITEFIPQLTVFAVAAFRLLPSAGRINEHVNNILYAGPSVDLIYNDLLNIEGYQEKFSQEEVNTEWKLTQEIKVKNVTYTYPNSDVLVLNKANCIIPKGKTVAFIGSSGAGKTTIIDVILGLLKPQYGKIMADDMDVYKNLKTWHNQLGYIPQSIYLSDDTIRNNIAFGVDEEEIDDNAIMEALKKAQLDEFVDGLIEGIDTFVGDRGIRLSGGQRQRIGIARALYHDPEILVLDEATSALDSETESAVMQSIETLRGQKTMLIIAHRLTTIQDADIIYEVKDGKIIERNADTIFE